MSNVPMDAWAERLLASIRTVMGIPPPSLTGRNPSPPPQPAWSFSIQSPAQTAKDKAKMDGKPKPVPFSGLPGYSERGVPDEWDLSMGEVFGYRWWYMPVPPVLVGYMGSVPFPHHDDFTFTPSDPFQLGVLYGANNQPWRDGKMEARCSMRYRTGIMSRQQITHEPPETREACGCGFWAYFNKGLNVASVLSANYGKQVPHLNSYARAAGIPVFGVVKGTGRVIIGEKGFRSQYAQIVGLCIPPVTVTQLSWWINSGIYTSSKEKCSEAEHLTRLSEVEAILSSTYPSARIFSDQNLLTSYFPPDANYA